MKKIFISGVTVLDFIFHLDAIPRVFEKYRTKNAFISGGGNAANASVAISKLGGECAVTVYKNSLILEVISQR